MHHNSRSPLLLLSKITLNIIILAARIKNNHVMAQCMCTCIYSVYKSIFNIHHLTTNVTTNNYYYMLLLLHIHTGIVQAASVGMLTLPQRIAPIVEAVLAQIKLKANLFHVFMDVLRKENSCLGDVIQRYYCK